MLLVDQVELLRQHFEELRRQKFSLPLMGWLSQTGQAYRFKSLLLPARDIATTITLADPMGNKLPPQLRGWNLDIEDGYGNSKRKILKELLGMIVHGYYFYVVENRLDISNDRGDRVIVPYNSFLSSVERLVLSPEDICLVICCLAEERLCSSQALQALETDIPGSGDLRHCIATIGRWPELKEKIWDRFFAGQRLAINSECRTINDVPFIKAGKHTESTVLWKMGWRRGDQYATSWINVALLIQEIRDYFSNSIP